MKSKGYKPAHGGYPGVCRRFAFFPCKTQAPSPRFRGSRLVDWNLGIKRKREGFTLVETLMVAAVILTLMSFSMPYLWKAFYDTERAARAGSGLTTPSDIEAELRRQEDPVRHAGLSVSQLNLIKKQKFDSHRERRSENLSLNPDHD